MKHTPLPWRTGGRFIDDANGQQVGQCESPEFAEFIVRAVNSHYDLLEALGELLAWAGQCTPDEYISWLRAKGTPGFEAAEVNTASYNAALQRGWAAIAKAGVK